MKNIFSILALSCVLSHAETHTQTALSFQNKLPDQSQLCSSQIKGIVMIGSTYFGMGSTTTIESFIAQTTTEIRTKIGNFLNAHPEFASASSFGIDLEYKAHPGQWYELLLANKPKFQQLMLATKNRAKILREEIKKRWPNNPAQVGLYGILTDSRGRRGTDPCNIPPNVEQGCPGIYVQQQRELSYIEAGKLGAFDLIQFVMPVLYPRFGPTDVTPSQSCSHYPNSWSWVNDSIYRLYVESGIAVAKTLRRSNASKIPVYPLFTNRTYNGPSCHHTQVFPISTMELMVEEARSGLNTSEYVVFWIADPNEGVSFIENFYDCP